VSIYIIMKSLPHDANIFDVSIRVTFTVADLQNLSESEQLNDEALEDELDGLEDSQSKGAVNKGSDGKIKVAPEDRVAPSDQPEGNEEGLEDENEPSYPARVNVTIDKPGKGSVHVETVAQDGLIQIENVSYFAKSELANAQTAEKEWSRQSLYSGPPFGNLDEDLQVLLERYLDERGIDTGLATFIPDYIDFKEQREYVGWLSSKCNPRSRTSAQPVTNSIKQTSRSSSMRK
jgi:complement component 1 Q subcomponent-binding protein